MFSQLLRLIPEIKTYILNLEPITLISVFCILSGKDDYLFVDDVSKICIKK